MPRPAASRGFTLLEMVVAIGIFAVIAAISYGALSNFLDARAHIDAETAELRSLQNVFTLLEQDLRYAVPRPVRDGYGDAQPAFTGGIESGLAAGERLRLTTTRPAPVGVGVPGQSRVAWRLRDGNLSRVSWRVLDRDVDSPEYQRNLMSGVQEIAFTFYARDEGALVSRGEWRGGELPAGVRVTVLLAGQAAYQRLFEVAGGS